MMGICFGCEDGFWFVAHLESFCRCMVLEFVMNG